MLWASGNSEDSYSIPVDRTVVRMMFSGTFDATGGSLTLIAPDGTVIQQGDRIDDTPLNCGRIITVDAPASGTWQVRRPRPAGSGSRVHAKSDVSLTDAAFVEHEARPESDRVVEIQGEPITGRPATLRVSISPTFKRPTFQLVSLDGRALQSIDLPSTDDLEFIGTITLPIEPFRVLVNGRDESGTQTQRVWPGLFQGEFVEVVPPAVETALAGAELPVTFTIRNHGPAVRLNLVSSDHRGNVIAVDPPTLELGAGAEGIATIQLKVPADVRAASEVSIRLTATSDGTAAVGGFNTASKTFSVIRE